MIVPPVAFVLLLMMGMCSKGVQCMNDNKSKRRPGAGRPTNGSRGRGRGGGGGGSDGGGGVSGSGRGRGGGSGGGGGAMGGSNPKKYLVLHNTTADEADISSWIKTVEYAVKLAKKTNRVFVEPCVRNGRIVPCGTSEMSLRFGQLVDVRTITTAFDVPIVSYADAKRDWKRRVKEVTKATCDEIGHRAALSASNKNKKSYMKINSCRLLAPQISQTILTISSASRHNFNSRYKKLKPGLRMPFLFTKAVNKRIANIMADNGFNFSRPAYSVYDYTHPRGAIVGEMCANSLRETVQKKGLKDGNRALFSTVPRTWDFSRSFLHKDLLNTFWVGQKDPFGEEEKSAKRAIGRDKQARRNGKQDESQIQMQMRMEKRREKRSDELRLGERDIRADTRMLRGLLAYMLGSKVEIPPASPRPETTVTRPTERRVERNTPSVSGGVVEIPMTFRKFPVSIRDRLSSDSVIYSMFYIVAGAKAEEFHTCASDHPLCLECNPFVSDLTREILRRRARALLTSCLDWSCKYSPLGYAPAPKSETEKWSNHKQVMVTLSHLNALKVGMSEGSVALYVNPPTFQKYLDDIKARDSGRKLS